MCAHFITIDRNEIKRIAAEIADDLATHEGELNSVDPLASFHAHLSQPSSTKDAYPSSVVALIVPTGKGTQLAIADMVWGFTFSWTRNVMFNTRMESALGHAEGLWAESITRRRCVVPATAFFETHSTETVLSERTGRQIKRPYYFRRTDGAPLLLAGIHDAGRFSLITTRPNDVVAPIHNRMPLVLEQDEATRWLTGDFLGLSERPHVRLIGQPAR